MPRCTRRSTRGAIGLSPRLSRWLQPVTQVAASFPAPMLFPLVIIAITNVGGTLATGSIALMLLGTQWYILFNVIAGAMAIPADLREAAHSYRLDLWARLRTLYLPAVLPQLLGLAARMQIEATDLGQFTDSGRFVIVDDGQTVAVISHADTLRAMLLYLMGMPVDYVQRLELSPGRISVVELGAGAPRIVQVNGETV